MEDTAMQVAESNPAVTHTLAKLSDEAQPFKDAILFRTDSHAKVECEVQLDSDDFKFLGSPDEIAVMIVTAAKDSDR